MPATQLPAVTQNDRNTKARNLIAYSYCRNQLFRLRLIFPLVVAVLYTALSTVV